MAAPGNPGIEALGRGKGPGAGKVVLAPVVAEAVNELVALASRERIGFVVCGPEVALNKGLGDAFAKQGIAFFGPSQAAAEIQGSKKFAKDLMKRAGVPTAAYGSFDDIAAADAFIDSQPGDVVVKADGLCAGKGVVVALSTTRPRPRPAPCCWTETLARPAPAWSSKNASPAASVP